ncbi:MAG: tRNA 2-thiouridine(34) synthase MnmA [Polyangiaceae bacterium]
MGRERVIVAMSGGVDSSVAAARLAREGFDVVGVTLHLWDYPDDGERGRCCAPEDQYDARAVADHLGIPHFTFDRRELFAREVVAPFVDAYVEGRTPSPCVTCNRTVKLRELLPLADRLGARFVATGHYARVLAGPHGPELHRGVDAQKDQSYFLHMLRADELERVLLPLGASTKEEVRADALGLALPGATKGESQELCFVPTGRYDAFVEARSGSRVRPGPILDTEGRVLGHHEGVHRFTIGQRKGLGVALGKPAFVVGIDANSAAVMVGAAEDLLAEGADLEAATCWSHGVELPLANVTIQVRARHSGAPGQVRRGPGGNPRVVFDEPVRAVSPGQVAVVYDGSRVLGGGTIEVALHAGTAHDGTVSSLSAELR